MDSTVVFVGLLVLAAVSSPAFAADHTVGGASGWDSTVDYSSWASGEAFNAKDTLTFTYSGLHSVYQVSKADYGSCSASNAITSDTSGSSKFTLDKAGTTYYFICGTTSHCLNGMKLAVTTAGGSGGGSSDGSTPSTPVTSSTPTAPAVTRGYGGYSYGAASPTAGGAAAVALAGLVAGLVGVAF